MNRFIECELPATNAVMIHSMNVGGGPRTSFSKSYSEAPKSSRAILCEVRISKTTKQNLIANYSISSCYVTTPYLATLQPNYHTPQSFLQMQGGWPNVKIQKDQPLSVTIWHKQTTCTCSEQISDHPIRRCSLYNILYFHLTRRETYITRWNSWRYDTYIKDGVGRNTYIRRWSSWRYAL